MVRSILIVWPILIVCALAAESSIYLPFVSDEVVDYPTVRIVMGKPERTYHLRLDLSDSSMNTSLRTASNAAILLYDDARTLRHRSTTYETLLPGILGRDMVQMGDTYMRANILFAVRPSAIPSASADSISLSVVGCDGRLWLAALYELWPMVSIDRHGVRLSGLTSQDVPDYSDRLATEQWGQALTLSACDSSTLNKTQQLGRSMNYPYGIECAGCVVAEIDAAHYTTCVATNIDASFMPQGLYTMHMGTENIYTLLAGDDPIHDTNWPNLHLLLRNGDRGAMPLSLLNHVVLPIVDGSGAFDMSRLEQTAALSATGSDALKVLPHTVDSTTIVLGGHVLWTLSILMKQRDVTNAQTEVRLLSHAAEDTFTFGEAIVFLFVVLLYLRWKLAIVKIEPHYIENVTTPFFIVRSGSDNILWPYALPLWFLPLVIALRWSTVQALVGIQIDPHIHMHVVVGGSVALASLLVLLPLEWGEITRWYRKLRQRQREQYGRRWRQWLWSFFTDPSVAIKTANERNKLDYEQHVATTSLRDAAIEVLSVTAIWFFFAPLESRNFALPVMLALLSVLTSCVIYHFCIVLFIIVWPAVQRRYQQHKKWSRLYTRLREEIVAVVVVLALAVAVAHSGYLLVRCALLPLFVQFAVAPSIYVPISTLFGGTLVFLSAALADVILQSFLVRIPSA